MEMKQNENKLKQENMEWKNEMEFLLYGMIDEAFDGISINSAHQGLAVRFGEKLYQYFSYVIRDPNLEHLKYIVKMDDYAVLCLQKIFEYLHNKNLTMKNYMSWFYNMNTWKNDSSY